MPSQSERGCPVCSAGTRTPLGPRVCKIADRIEDRALDFKYGTWPFRWRCAVARAVWRLAEAL